jgi:hypothetical protein
VATRGRVPVEGLGNSTFESRLIWAPSPDDRTLAVRLFRDPETADQMGADDRDIGLAMYAGHIHGAIAYTDLEGKSRAQIGRGLLEATALFRGVHRPMIKPNLDGRVYAYVSTPRSTFVRPMDRHELRLGPFEALKPENAVFVTFVLFDDDAVRRWDREIRDAHGENVDGIVVDWEWTLADPYHPDLPDDYNGRYDERKW